MPLRRNSVLAAGVNRLSALDLPQRALILADTL